MVAPFAAALISGALLNRLGWFWAALSVPLGFYVTAWMVSGLQLLPLTSTHKILLLGLAAAVVGLALDAYPGIRRHLPWVLFIAGAAASTWVVWPVLMRREGLAFWRLAAGAAVYAGWLTAASGALRTRPLPAGAMILSLALGTAVCAVFGASTLLGQLAASLSAASGAFLLLAVVLRRHQAGATLVTPAVLLCGLLGVSGCVYARLPWFSLAVLMLLPPLARLPLGEGRAAWIKASLSLIATLPVTLAAIVVARHLTGPLPSL